MPLRYCARPLQTTPHFSSHHQLSSFRYTYKQTLARDVVRLELGLVHAVHEATLARPHDRRPRKPAKPAAHMHHPGAGEVHVPSANALIDYFRASEKLRDTV